MLYHCQRMTDDVELPPHLGLAVSFARASDRPFWQSLFLLDEELARAVDRVNEPIAGQIRLAWWRDRLVHTDHPERASVPILRQILHLWSGSDGALVPLVDAWERILLAAPGEAEWFDAIAARAEGLCAIDKRIGGVGRSDILRVSLELYTMADIALRHPERRMKPPAISNIARSYTPRRARPAAVLRELAVVSLATDQRFLASRRAILAAWRAGTFGW